MTLNPGCAAGNAQSKAGCTPCLTSKYPSGRGMCPPAFPFPFSFPETLQTQSTEWQILPGCRENFYWNFRGSHWAKTLLSPSRRIFPEVNPKLRNVKDKFSVGSWQVFDILWLNEMIQVKRHMNLAPYWKLRRITLNRRTLYFWGKAELVRKRNVSFSRWLNFPL